MAKLRLELSANEACLLWQCIVGQKARQTKRIVERLDTYADLPDALRKAADTHECLGRLAVQMAEYCASENVDVSAGMP